MRVIKLSRRKLAIVLAVGLTATAVLSFASSASASSGGNDKGHHKKHDRDRDRKHDHDNHPTGSSTSSTSASSSSTSSSSTSSATHATSSSTSNHTTRTACKVTGTKAGVTATTQSFVIHFAGDCGQTQKIYVSVQTQPGPWHDGLCKEPGANCKVVKKYPLTVHDGQTITVDVPCGFVQVDITDCKGTLIVANHSSNTCTSTTSTTSSSSTSSTSSSTTSSSTTSQSTTSSSTTTEPVTSITTTDVGSGLPRTGTELRKMLTLAGLVLGGGILLMLFASRPKRNKH